MSVFRIRLRSFLITLLSINSARVHAARVLTVSRPALTFPSRSPSFQLLLPDTLLDDPASAGALR